ncbi:MAG: hypothetical protein R2850_06610 [Bacteroidia bacterium]
MLKIAISFLFAVATISCAIAQNNMGIGTSSPDPSAKLHILSDNSGLLIPSMTTQQREAIANPANGLMVFDTQDSSFWYFGGSLWTRMSADNDPAPEPPVERIFSNLNQTGIAGTNETTIGTAIIPASETTTDGAWIELHAFGTISTDTGMIITQIENVILNFEISGSGSWELRVRFYRFDSLNMKASGTLYYNGISNTQTASGAHNFNSDATLGIKASQTNAVLNGISLEGFSILRSR